ncbi:MAG: hypothetical protein R3D52_03795 [Xanthobacteraceae bacterium]
MAPADASALTQAHFQFALTGFSQRVARCADKTVYSLSSPWKREGTMRSMVVGVREPVIFSIAIE